MRHAVAGLVVVVACQSNAPSTPTAVVQQFYRRTMAEHMSGAPSSEQLASLTPVLSDTLRALLAAAHRRNGSDAARAPDEKPAFADGDLFSSLFEGPNAIEVLGDSARGAVRIASVRMTYNRTTPPVTWVDRMVLTRERGRYVVDDIEYGGTWDFATKGSLRRTLVDGLSSPP